MKHQILVTLLAFLVFLYRSIEQKIELKKN